jgi:hypothetical protein
LGGVNLFCDIYECDWREFKENFVATKFAVAQ